MLIPDVRTLPTARRLVFVGLFALSACSSDATVSDSTTPDVAASAPSTEQADEPISTDAPPPEPPPTEPPPTEPPSTEALADPEPTATVRAPDVELLSDEGNGTIAPLASAPLPAGYTESEYTFAGEATSYASSGELDPDGFWDAVESGTNAEFTSRLIVRAPPANDFSGVVLVEWMNVTAGTDTTPDWGFLHEMIGREGHAYVAVSAQFVGVMGDDSSFIDGGIVDTRGLGVKDPDRYGRLVHPGDEFAYDIFTQAGVAIDGATGLDVLGGLEPSAVIALGESQSAFFMTGYVNAVHPLVGLYDGFLIHSRGGSAVAPDGSRGDSIGGDVRVRTDLDAPVLQFQTETDMFELGFLPARQPDSETVRTWEVAGTAHADAYSLHASGLPRDASSGTLLGCETPINDGPQHETLSAAVHHLVAWVVDGTVPPSSPLLEAADGAFVRDDLGLALGGVRTPVVDAPLRILTGEPGPDGGSCFLFGQTIAFDANTIASLYDGLDDWSGQASAAAAAAVDAGWLLPPDSESMLAESAALAAMLGLN